MTEIFEQKSNRLQELFKFNPRKCNSASSFSCCVHRDKNKCFIALPTNSEHIILFEKTLNGGFSCVNTSLVFDSQILLPNKDTHKLIYDTEGQKKRVSTKILKMDENNQYSNAITRPLPYGCIKRAPKVPSLLEFNRILDSLSHEDKIGHLFIVDIKFFNKNEKTLLFNEIYTPIFEKEKIIEPQHRSVLQLLSIIN